MTANASSPCPPEEKFPKLNGKVLINNIGGLIGAHTGPGTVALFFWGGERVD